MNHNVKRVCKREDAKREDGNREDGTIESSANEEALRLGRRPREASDNTERALIAAARRTDRSLEGRIVSAKNASNLHFRNQGRYFYLTEKIILDNVLWEDLLDEQQMRDPDLILPDDVTVQHVLWQYAKETHPPLPPYHPLLRAMAHGGLPPYSAPNPPTPSTIASNGFAATNTIAQNHLSMMGPPPRTLNPASLSMMPFSIPVPPLRGQPRFTPNQQTLDLEQARREDIANAYRRNITGFPRAETMARGFCDGLFALRQHQQTTFSVPPGELHPQQSTLGQQQMFPFGPTDASSLPPRRGAITPFDPVFDPEVLFESFLTDSKESDEQQEDSQSSDETNNVEIDDEKEDEKAEMNETVDGTVGETVDETDDPSVKPQAGLDVATTVDENLTGWKSEWANEPSEFETAFLAVMGGGRSLEEIFNPPADPSQNEMFGPQTD